jgi:exonuclease SbcC
MIIKSIALRNFRRFKNLSFEFPENLIGIIGPNGSGKTTLLEAIGWVLYGIDAVRTLKSEVRSQFAENREVCAVEMVFEIGGQDYRVRRQLRGKQDVVEAALYRAGNEQPDAVQDRGVTEYVETLLALDYQSFFASVFARQRDLAALSEMRPEERRKAINRLINIDRIDRAREAVRKASNEKQAFVQGKESSLKDLDQIQKQAKEQQDAIALQEKEAAAEKEKVSEIKAEREKRRKELEEIEAVRDKFNERQKKIETLAERLKNLEAEKMRFKGEIEKIRKAKATLEMLRPVVAKFEKIKNEKEEWDALELRFKRLENKQEMEKRLQTDLKEMNAEEKNWSALVSELKKEIEELKELGPEPEELEKQQESFHEQEVTLQGKVEAIRRKLEEIKGHQNKIQELGADSACLVCTRPLGENYDEVMKHFSADVQSFSDDFDEKNKQLQTVRENSAILRDRLKKSRDRHRQREKLLSRDLEIRKNIETANQKIEKKKRDLKAVEDEIVAIGKVEYKPKIHAEKKKQFEEIGKKREQALALEAQVNRLPELEALLDKNSEISGITQGELETVKKHQEELNFKEEEFIKCKKQAAQATLKLEQANVRFNEMQQKLALLKQELNILKTEIKHQRTLRKEIDSLKEEIYYFQLLVQYFGEFRLELAGRIRPIIAHRASELLSLTTNSRYSLLELDADYNIAVYDGTEAFGIKRYSGGEQDLVSLCLRIAISQVVAERSGGNPLNFIILDEIFGSQDQERKGLILNALNQLSSQFRQIFIVTHIEDIKDFLPVLIEVKQADQFSSVAELV